MQAAARTVASLSYSEPSIITRIGCHLPGNDASIAGWDVALGRRPVPTCPIESDICYFLSVSTTKKHIAVVPGDGIGKEVIAQATNVVNCTGAAVSFTEFDWSADRYLQDGTTIPADGFTMLGRD